MLLPPPYDKFEDFRVYVSQRDARRMVSLTGESAQLLTTYARYLYQIDLWQREASLIPDGYEVDHINNNRLDDRLDNYQLLTKEENRRKQNAFRGIAKFVLACPVCGTLFTRIRYQMNPKSVICCSTGCMQDFAFSTIPEAVRERIVGHQIKYLSREYRTYGEIQLAHTIIEESRSSCLWPNTIHNTKEWCPVAEASGVIIDNFACRKQAIVRGLARGDSVRKIARDLDMHHSSVFYQMKVMNLSV